MADALVFFTDKTDIAWLKCLKRGYKHCFCAVDVGGQWVLLDSLSKKIDVFLFKHMAVEEIVDFYKQSGYSVLSWQAEEAKGAFPCDSFTCVALCKRVLGLKARMVLTPYQLYKRLLAGGAYEWK